MSWFGQTTPPAAWPKYRKPPYTYAALVTVSRRRAQSLKVEMRVEVRTGGFVNCDQSRIDKSGHVRFHGIFIVFITTWILHWIKCHCQTMERQCIRQPHNSSTFFHEKGIRKLSF